MSRRRIMVIAGILLVLLVGILMLVRSIHSANEKLANMYAAMQVGLVIADYVEVNRRWPTSWEELQPALERQMGMDKINAYHRNVQRRVDVKWDVTLDELRKARSPSAPPFPVVWCLSGDPAGPGDFHDANFLVFQSLQALEYDQSNVVTGDR